MDAFVIIDSNVATIGLPPDLIVSFSVRSNSGLTQKVIFSNTNGELYNFTGSGQRVLIGEGATTFNSKFQITFTWEGNGNSGKSTLQSGGPYTIGRTNLLVVVAENGGNADFNDCVVQFTWKG